MKRRFLHRPFFAVAKSTGRLPLNGAHLESLDNHPSGQTSDACTLPVYLIVAPQAAGMDGSIASCGPRGRGGGHNDRLVVVGGLLGIHTSRRDYKRPSHTHAELLFLSVSTHARLYTHTRLPPTAPTAAPPPQHHAPQSRQRPSLQPKRPITTTPREAAAAVSILQPCITPHAPPAATHTPNQSLTPRSRVRVFPPPPRSCPCSGTRRSSERSTCRCPAIQTHTHAHIRRSIHITHTESANR